MDSCFPASCQSFYKQLLIGLRKATLTVVCFCSTYFTDWQNALFYLLYKLRMFLFHLLLPRGLRQGLANVFCSVQTVTV